MHTPPRSTDRHQLLEVPRAALKGATPPAARFAADARPGRNRGPATRVRGPRPWRVRRFGAIVLAVMVATLLGHDVPGAAAPQAVNMRYAIEPAFGLFAEGQYAAFAVDESASGMDFTGDGDLNDHVAHVWDSKNGKLYNSKHDMRGNAHTSFCLDGDILSFAADEDGNHDFNTDGDRTDKAVAIWDLAAQTLEFVERAAAGDVGIACGAGRVAFRAHESDEGADLNGDGDLADLVWHVYTVASQNIRNLELATIATMHTTGRMNRRALVFEAFELPNSMDLNGDGDQDDRVLFTHVFSSNNVVASGFAGTMAFDERHYSAKAYGRYVPFRADEAEAGQDLNGDGDAVDVVIHAIDTRTGAVVLGAAGDALRSTSRWLTLIIDEAADGNQDLTGDGDTSDHVVVFKHARTGATWNTTMAVDGSTSGNPYVRSDHGMGFLERLVSAEVDETASGWDVNGDGQVTGHPVVTFDPRYNTVDRTAGFSRSLYDPEHVLPVGKSYAVAARRESASTTGDLNGDGDTLDTIAQSVNIRTGVMRNTGLAMDLTHPMRLSGESGFVVVNEAAHGAGSLNGDGDTMDDVLHLVDLPTGDTLNLGVDVHDNFGGSAAARLWNHNAYELLFGASERAQDADLNGDGDKGDHVVHRLGY